MKIKHSLLIILLCLAHAVSSGQVSQQAIDSLRALTQSPDKIQQVQALIELSRAYWQINVDSTFIYANQALAIAEQSKDNILLGNAYNNRGNAYQIKKEYEKSIEDYNIALSYRKEFDIPLMAVHSLINSASSYFNLNEYSETLNSLKEAFEIANTHKLVSEQSFVLNYLANTYSTINDNNLALEYAIKAASTHIQTENKAGLASSYNFIGTIHRKLGNKKLALEYFLKAYEIQQSEKINQGLSNTLNNLGIIYNELSENEKALDYYKKARNLAIEDNDKSGQSAAYNNIGMLSSEIKNYDEAISSYKKSIALSEEVEDYASLLNTNNNLAWIYYHQGDVNMAMHFVQKALSYADKCKELVFISESYEILSKIYYQQQNYKRGFEHLEKIIAINDSLYKASSIEQLMETQVRFETERKEKEIELLKKNDQIKSLDLQRQKNLNAYWIIIMIMLVAFSITIILFLRAKLKVNKLLTEKNVQLKKINKKLVESEVNLKGINTTKDRLFSIIAHDLKNPFNALLGFSELLFKNISQYTENEIKDLVKIIYDSSQNLYKLLENLLQWSRSQLGSIMYKPELFPLTVQINEELELLKPAADKKQINILLQVEEHLIVWADRNLVGVVVRNLISNAIKFSDNNDEITISATEDENMVKIAVKDNGVGINDADKDKLFRLDTNFTSQGTAGEKGSGLGLLLCKEFVKKNGGEIWIENNPNKGMIFFFTLPSYPTTQSNT
ncbi:MAG: tetratricopeptide repeat protein [Tenuifilaceae bacterium]|nr:tetratricopeptide repeat protein [Tenuifilaceae bacterium]